MIRAATLAEVDAITAIERGCFGAEAWSPALVIAAIESERNAVLIDEVDAYGAVAVAGEIADLERIAVMPARRREGLAGALLDALSSAARSQGATRMLLEVAADNEAALGFYKAYGFVPISRRSGYYRRGIDAIVMQLELEEAR